MAEKDLQYYLDNPEDLPSDPAELARLAQALDGTGNTETTDKQDEPSATSGAKAEPAPAEAKQDPKVAAAPAEKTDTATAEEAPVATRDGKRTIPYDVLKTERERRQAAEDTVRDLATKLESMQQQLAKGTTQGDAAAAQIAQSASENLSGEELDALRTDFPVVGRMVDTLLGQLDAQNQRITAQNQRIEELTQREQSRQAEHENAAALSVQEHIDNEPLLAHLQAKDPQMFARAVELDKTLSASPKYATDLAKRFAKVAAEMDELYGPFDGFEKPPAPPPATDSSVSKEDARKAVAKQLEQTSARPRSLSDLPSGETPASDDRDAIENSSVVEIGDRLLRMTPEQRAAYLNRF